MVLIFGSAVHGYLHMTKLITILVPAYNEAEVLDIFLTEIRKVTSSISGYSFDFLFVNDGSTDETLTILERMAIENSDIGYLSLTRNFGKEAAMTAGLDHVKADAIVIFDADLQDPPELLHDFVREWKAGYDVVYAQREIRDGESWVKKATASLFYSLMKRISRTPVPPDTGDCRLMSRRAVESLNKLRENNRFMKGLFAWVGYPSKAVLYNRAPRAAGTTKFNYWKLWNFALDGITSFTDAPLKLATYIGFFISLFSFFFGAWIIFKTIVYGESVAGYPTIMVTILFLGGMQMFFIGVLGEYLGRIFTETKRRPIYLVDQSRLPGGGLEVRKVENSSALK